MRFLFSPDSMIMQVLNRLCDLVILNILFLLTCLPVFTIGAAVTALYDTVFRMDTDREGKLLSTYFHAFRGNFRQSTVIFLILVLYLLASTLNAARYEQSGLTLGFGLAVLVQILVCMVASYVFPLLSQFRNTTGWTMKNALLLSIAHFPRSAVLLAVNGFPWALMFVNFYAFMRLGILWFSLYFAAAAYCNSRVLMKVFDPYRI